MYLKFLGNGSGFTDEHTSAYFITGKELVLLDCPASSLKKLKQLDLKSYENIYVLITHTHGDHVGGIGLFAQYMYFKYNKLITVVAPSEEVKNGLEKFMEFEGVMSSCYKIMISSMLTLKKWYGSTIKTEHTEFLKGKCFGYELVIDGANVIYTGDTCILTPFYDLLKSLEGRRILYVDVSFNKSEVHLYLMEILPQLIALANDGVDVYLMHLDDINAVRKEITNYSKIKIAEIE